LKKLLQIKEEREYRWKAEEIRELGETGKERWRRNYGEIKKLMTDEVEKRTVTSNPITVLDRRLRLPDFKEISP
jgi:hypothetical protein